MIREGNKLLKRDSKLLFVVVVFFFACLYFTRFLVTSTVCQAKQYSEHITGTCHAAIIDSKFFQPSCKPRQHAVRWGNMPTKHNISTSSYSFQWEQVWDKLLRNIACNTRPLNWSEHSLVFFNLTCTFKSNKQTNKRKKKQTGLATNICLFKIALCCPT